MCAGAGVVAAGKLAIFLDVQSDSGDDGPGNCDAADDFRRDGHADAQDKAAEILKRVELGHRLFNKPSEAFRRATAAWRLWALPTIRPSSWRTSPYGDPDLNTGKAIIELLRQMNRERDVTVISATHDFKMLDVSDRIIWIATAASTGSKSGRT